LTAPSLALSLAQPGESTHFLSVKTLALEDIYANPHTLDSFLASGEPVVVVRAGQVVADLVPKPAASAATERKRPDFKARFRQMWGADAFDSKEPVAGQFATLRRDRRP